MPETDAQSVAGQEPQPDRWHASAGITEADLAPFTQEDLDEAGGRLTRLALDALPDIQLDDSPGEGLSFRELARHLGGSTYYADAVGDLA
ncbi:hypothetical protein ABZT17_21550 [Streptomyces sp. NPDC005648]|uniref:hypothetical protein n=1 Tax=Streptomyces sp. NPDC005648 TaxID=3157044 RepID=UPI0033A7868E